MHFYAHCNSYLQLPRSENSIKFALTDEWIKMMWSKYSGLLLSHKKNEILQFEATWMDLEGVMLSGISQMAKNRYHVL